MTFTKLRLDIVVATKEWIEKIGNQKIEVLNLARLDYQLILISTTSHLVTKHSKTKIFIFDACWIKHEDEEQVIQDAWARNLMTSNMW